MLNDLIDQFEKYKKVVDDVYPVECDHCDGYTLTPEDDKAWNDLIDFMCANMDPILNTLKAAKLLRTVLHTIAPTGLTHEEIVRLLDMYDSTIEPKSYGARNT